MATDAMTPQEMAIWASLPEEFKEALHGGATFGVGKVLALIQRRLEQFYGRRADWERNLRHDQDQLTGGSACLEVKDVASVPELTVDDVKGWIWQEEEFSRRTSRLLALRAQFDAADVECRDAAVWEAAGLLGLRGPDQDAIYQWIVDWDGMTAEEAVQVERRIQERPKPFKMLVSMLISRCVDGMQVTYPVLGTVMTQRKQRWFYRGENAIYGNSRPAVFRRVPSGVPDYLERRVRLLRLNDGARFIDGLSCVRGWSYGSVNHVAICQHYGLATQMLDVTSDVWAALFFACSAYEGGRWRPLRKTDFERIDSRPWIAARGGDARYAMLFRRLAEPVELGWALKTDDDIESVPVPIGYQPFMRCASQHAYGMFVRDAGYDLYRDHSFAKYKIRLTEDLCEWVFSRCHEGGDIYPVRDVPGLTECMDAVGKTWLFSRPSFEQLMRDQGIPQGKWNEAEFDLLMHGYQIAHGDVDYVSAGTVERIDATYTPEYVRGILGAVPVARPVVTVRWSGE